MRCKRNTQQNKKQAAAQWFEDCKRANEWQWRQPKKEYNLKWYHLISRHLVWTILQSVFFVVASSFVWIFAFTLSCHSLYILFFYSIPFVVLYSSKSQLHKLIYWWKESAHERVPGDEKEKKKRAFLLGQTTVIVWWHAHVITERTQKIYQTHSVPQ